MTAFQVLATLLTIAAVFAYVNHRWVKLPAAIALMAMSLAASLALIAVDRLGWVSLVGTAEGVLERVQLSETLLHGMLGALLFAGALHIDVSTTYFVVVFSILVQGLTLGRFARRFGAPAD